jgi:AhpD family alkylhydroperoxidase
LTAGASTLPVDELTVGRVAADRAVRRLDQRPPQVGRAMQSARDMTKALVEPGARLRKTIPDLYDAYTPMSKAVIADGALPAKIKELVALAIAATRECDGCISAHARGAARQGATEAEVAETMSVVIMMNDASSPSVPQAPGVIVDAKGTED